MVELRETTKDTLTTPTSLPLTTPPIATTTTTTPADPTVATDATTQPQYGKSIDILSLFKQASAPLPLSSTGAKQDAPRDVDPTAVPAPPRDDRPTDLLNKLFAKTSINGLAPLPAPTPSTSTGPLVDPQNSMYIDALVPGPTIPQPPQPSSSSTTSSSHNHQPQPTPKSVVEGRSLLALLQHSDTTAPSSIPHLPLVPPFASTVSPPPSTGTFPPTYPLRVSSPFPPPQAPPSFSPRGSNPSHQQPQPAMLYGPISPRVGPQQGFPILTPTLGGAPPLLPAQAFDVARGEMGRRFGSGAKVMSKPEFIQQFLNLVQNDPTFIDALYNSYVVQARTQPPMGPSPLPPVMGMGVNMGMGGPPPTASVSSQHQQHPAGGFYLGGQMM
ncbi:hypothetical protein BC938DRAFT_473317 [Jimgerdemannia flammicorona]|uniref:Uncharacterized protein n=1 Tax=Jimgerdemannia flammicorona TaxID=994334 RepID=A0A433Q477_9FUNG|nr:hypothetical protein BC938DRAFT_473317 [Jimgerdemannia flammicorona]